MLANLFISCVLATLVQPAITDQKVLFNPHERLDDIPEAFLGDSMYKQDTKPCLIGPCDFAGIPTDAERERLVDKDEPKPEIVEQDALAADSDTHTEPLRDSRPCLTIVGREGELRELKGFTEFTFYGKKCKPKKCTNSEEKLEDCPCLTSAGRERELGELKGFTEFTFYGKKCGPKKCTNSEEKLEDCPCLTGAERDWISAMENSGWMFGQEM